MMIMKSAQKFLLLSATLGLLLSLAPSEANAQSFAIFGKLRQFCCNKIPAAVVNSFPFAGGGGGVQIETPNGGWGIPVGLGAGPDYDLSVAADAFGFSGNFTNTQPGFPGWITIATAVNFANGAGVMAAGGQIGTRSYCIDQAGNPNCTGPSNVGGGTNFGGVLNGRLAYKAGVKNFGGTMRILGGTPGFLLRTTGGPSVRRKGYFAAPLSQIGGPFSEYRPESNFRYFYATPFTPNNTLPTSTTTQMIVFAGLPWGTGTVYGAGTGGAGFFATQSFSHMGGDARVSGLGNISLVSASMVAGLATDTFPVAAVLSLAVPEPSSIAMFAGGMAGIVLLGMRGRRS